MTIQQNYGKHEYFDDFFHILEAVIIDKSLDNLAELNIKLTLSIMNFLGIHKKVFRSSMTGVSGNRSDRILNLCHAYNCSTYLSPAGARDYISEDGVLLTSDVSVLFQDFICEPYAQRGLNKFVPYMSIIDVVFNLGPNETKRYLSKEIK
jgi:hypothetical protein